MISPFRRQAAFPPGAAFAQVLRNPALRGSADSPGMETKPVGHFPEAPMAPFRSSAQRSASGKSSRWVLPFHHINLLIYLRKDILFRRQNKNEMHSTLCFPLPGDLRQCYSSELLRNIIARLSVSHFIL